MSTNDPNEYEFCAIYRNRETGVRAMIAARSIPDLESAWDAVTSGEIELDKSRIQKIQITKKEETP